MVNKDQESETRVPSRYEGVEETSIRTGSLNETGYFRFVFNNSWVNFKRCGRRGDNVISM